MKEVSLSGARELLGRAEAAAEKSGIKVSATVVDAAGRLVASIRQDGALPASAELSGVKAQTAVLFAMPTKELAAAGALAPAFSRPVAFVGGGVPLLSGGTVVGAIGIAGGMPDHDHELAVAVAKSF